MLSRNYRNAMRFISGIGIGLTAGCAIGMLVAPQAGKRTRRKIASAVEEGVGFIASKAEDAAELARQGTTRLQNEGKDWLGRGQAVIGRSKTRMARLHRAR